MELENGNQNPNGANPPASEGQTPPPASENKPEGQENPQENKGATATPPSNEGDNKQTTPPDDDKKSFTQSQVNEIVRERLNKDRDAFYKRYGVKDKDELDNVVGKAQSFDVMKERYDKMKLENKSLKEKVAFMSNNIDPTQEDDVRAIFKGKGLEFNEENLAKEIATHPHWIKKVAESTPPSNPDKPQTTIKELGVDHEHKQEHRETEDEKQKRIFGY